MGFTSNDDFLRSRIEDVISLCERRNMPVFYGFLDEGEQQEAKCVLAQYNAANYAFWGGFDEAERCILGFFPEYMSVDFTQFPLTAVGFTYRVEKPLSHRDFLGTLLSQGIKRETIGDILCGDGLSVVMLREEITPFICEQVKKVGGVGVTPMMDYIGVLPQAHTYLPLQDTIASPRLDAVVKSLLRSSREKAAQTIAGGLVSIDHISVTEVSARVEAPCVISIRGNGRFMVDQIGPMTKKGRLIFTARKCI